MVGCIDEVPGTLNGAIGEGNDGYAVAFTDVCHSINLSKSTSCVIGVLEVYTRNL